MTSGRTDGLGRKPRRIRQPESQRDGSQARQALRARLPWLHWRDYRISPSRSRIGCRRTAPQLSHRCQPSRRSVQPLPHDRDTGASPARPQQMEAHTRAARWHAPRGSAAASLTSDHRRRHHTMAATSDHPRPRRRPLTIRARARDRRRVKVHNHAPCDRSPVTGHHAPVAATPADASPQVTASRRRCDPWPLPRPPPRAVHREALWLACRARIAQGFCHSYTGPDRSLIEPCRA